MLEKGNLSVFPTMLFDFSKTNLIVTVTYKLPANAVHLDKSKFFSYGQ